MRGLILLVAISGLGIWWGGQNTYTALRDQSPHEISCAAYVERRPEARWLKLTGCEYDLDNMAVEQTGNDKHVTAVYIPLRPAGVKDGPTKIVLVRKDDDMIRVAQAGQAGDAQPEPATSHVIAQMAEPTQGLVQFGLDLSDKDQKQLQGLGLGLATDFALIDYDSKPKLLFGLLALAAGLAAAAFLAYRLVRRFRG